MRAHPIPARKSLRALSSRARSTWTIAAIAATGLVLYRGALSAGFMFWDDSVYITRNPLVHELSLENVARVFTSYSNCNYHPLTYLTWMVEFALVGLSPWLYHLDNVLLHIASSVTVYFLTRRLLESHAAGSLAAFLFLVHPLRVESVAWIAERKDVLCAFFYLAGLLAYVRSIDGERRCRLAAFALFVAALLSKAMAVTFPAVQVLLLLYRRRLDARNLLATTPFLVTAAAFAVVAWHAQASFEALRGLHGGDLTAHLLAVPEALAAYAGKLLLPYPLSPRYVMEPAGSLADPHVLLGLALIASGAVASWASYRRSRRVFLGLGFFAVTWAPVSGIVPTSTLLADRYMYLPALGLLWPLAGAAARALESARGTSRSRVWALGPAATLGALLAFGVLWSLLGERRVDAWSDGVVLWEDALRENPENPFAHNQLALEYLARGRYAEAARAAIASVRYGLDEPEHAFNLALAYRALEDGEKELAVSRALLASDPDFLPAWNVALRHLREGGRDAEHDRELARLLARFPGHPTLLAARGDAHLARGDAHLARGELESALHDYVAVLDARRDDREALLGLAAAISRMGDERAPRLVERALAIPGGALWPWEVERVDEVARRAGDARAAGSLRNERPVP